MTSSESPSDAADFSIRTGGPNDVVELDRLIGLLADHLDDRHRYHSTPESFARYGFGANPLFETLLAVDQSGAGSDTARGACVYLPTYSTWLARPGVYLLDLVVEPQHRRRGIGSALLTEAARRGRRQWDADFLLLSVDRANHGAARFYEREGFEIDHLGRTMVRRGLNDLVG